MTIHWLGGCYWKYILIKNIDCLLVHWSFHYFSALLWSLWKWFLRKIYVTVFLGSWPEIIPKRQQRGLSLEKVTKRLMGSLIVCSPMLPAEGCPWGDCTAALQGGLVTRCTSYPNGPACSLRPTGWSLPGNCVASLHPHRSPLGLRMLRLLLSLIRALALHRISTLWVLASGPIWQGSHDNSDQRCPATRRWRAGPCLFVPGVKSVQAGNRQEEKDKRVGNLIQEVLRRVSLWAGLSWGGGDLVMHLRLVGILKSHVNSRDAEYLCFRVVCILKSFCLWL